MCPIQLSQQVLLNWVRFPPGYLLDYRRSASIRSDSAGGCRWNRKQVIPSHSVGHERHNGTKPRGVKQYWNVWIPYLLPKPLTLTYGDTLQPVLLRQLNDKWSCLSANICYSSAAWVGTARPADCMVLAWQSIIKPNLYSSSHTILANQQPNSVIWAPSTTQCPYFQQQVESIGL